MSAPAAPDPALAATLKRERLSQGITQEEMAHKAQLTVAAYARLERGHANPMWTTVVNLASALDHSVVGFAAQVQIEQVRLRNPGHSCDKEIREAKESGVVISDSYAETGDKWRCSCGKLYEHVCDEAEGCSWVAVQAKAYR